ncbi:DUF4271 domain-containing protein [Flagellimonas allohymeniacidonis]|uniref:DUF4271 domain-containing protein n=1 Tax=Flagellimonas allohymeniacidonis TaxID=2517819 RepID=A0A4Q8QC56_9FLAO|nr:DUF4271 domain-containing protein [Allomuricauda hymeniacidonis]TAI47945.1 DUF4271 domain-containing protein [Allomuricauda hymeniacidonis]
MNPIYKTVESFDWMTIAILLSLVVITLAKYMFQTRFLSFLILPFNNKYIVLYNKKGRLFSWFHVLMTLFQLINLSLFIFLAWKAFFPHPSNDPIPIFALIFALVGGFQVLKVLLQSVKGFVFNTNGLVSEIIYTKLTYLNHSSLIMLISNILLIYVLQDSKTVIYITIILVFSINTIGLANLLKNYQKVLVPNIFYFILYLCTLEIAPLVVIGSYLKV